MVKTVTSLSIEADLLEKYRQKFGARASFSDYVEKLVSKELGQIISISDLESKMESAFQDYTYFSDLKDDLLKTQQMQLTMKTEDEKKKLELIKQEKEQKLQEWVNKTKDIPELIQLIEEVKSNKTLIADSKYVMAQTEILRAKYPTLRIGAFQLRDILIKLGG